MTPEKYDAIVKAYSEAVDDTFKHPSEATRQRMYEWQETYNTAVAEIIAEWRSNKTPERFKLIKRLRKVMMVVVAITTLSFAETAPVATRDIFKSLNNLAIKANKNGMPRTAVKIDKLALEVYAMQEKK